jgi:hypothetical protein
LQRGLIPHPLARDTAILWAPDAGSARGCRVSPGTAVELLDDAQQPVQLLQIAPDHFLCAT